jgi:protein-S-isoprenylcysteine O-methyltransferase Ste14
VSASNAPTETAAVAPAPAWLVRYGNFLFKYRDMVFPAVLLGILALSPPRWPLGDEGLDAWLDVLGILVALAGQVLRIATIGYAYIIRGGRDKKVYAEELVTRGLFEHCRNPLYVGNILILLGLLLVWNSVAGYVIGVPFFLLGYVAIVAAEEAFLRTKFGPQYDAYRARVPRWGIRLPRWGVRLRGLRASMDGMTFNWARVILKEYGSAAYWIAGVCVLMILDSRPWSAHPVAHVALVATIGLVVLLWAFVRWLKKSERLTH